jgi:hypothetical protein
VRALRDRDPAAFTSLPAALGQGNGFARALAATDRPPLASLWPDFLVGADIGT